MTKKICLKRPNRINKKGARHPFAGNAVAAKSYICIGRNHISGRVKK